MFILIVLAPACVTGHTTAAEVTVAVDDVGISWVASLPSIDCIDGNWASSLPLGGVDGGISIISSTSTVRPHRRNGAKIKQK